MLENWEILASDEERLSAIAHKLQTGETKYFYDENGDEYWYQNSDNKRHYTRIEG